MAYNKFPFTTRECLKAHVVSDFWGFRFHDKVQFEFRMKQKLQKRIRTVTMCLGKPLECITISFEVWTKW